MSYTCLIHAHLSLVVPFLNGFHLFLPRVIFVALDEKWHVLFSGGGETLALFMTDSIFCYRFDFLFTVPWHLIRICSLDGMREGSEGGTLPNENAPKRIVSLDRIMVFLAICTFDVFSAVR